MKNFVLAAVAAGVFATPAAAQDFPGLRIEGYAGYDDVTADLSYEDSDFPEDNFSIDGSTDDLMYGVAIGYDYPISDGFYLGVEATVDFSDNSRCEEAFGDDEACFKLKRNFGVGARLGARVSGRAIVYAGAAYVNGKAEASYEDFIDPDYNFTVSDTRDGYRLSLGAEARVAGNMFVKAELRHTNYSDYEYEVGTERATLGFRRNQVLGGVGFRF